MSRLLTRTFGSLVALLLLLAAGPVMAQTVTVRGFVTNGETGEALEDANVLLATTDGQQAGGATTNEEGYYQMGDVTPGRYILQIRFVGFSTYRDTIRVGGNQEVVTRSAKLQPSQQQMEEVTVEAESDGGPGKVEAGRQKVRVADIERIPTPSVSGDLASYLQSLPGVVSVGDRGGQLYVRGGTPSQNMIKIDGTPIYDPFHIIGFYSVFSDDLVSNADFYAGGFGGEYRGRISSVIDVTMRPGNKQRFRGAASISPFVGEIRVEGPLYEDSFSFIASARQSVIEQTAPRYLSEDLPLKFSDVYLKLHDVSESSQCAATAMRTYDRGRIDPERDEVFRWENLTVGGRCRLVIPNQNQFVDVSAGVSSFTNAVGVDGQTGPAREAGILRIHNDVSLTRPLWGAELNYGFRGRLNQYDFRVGQEFGAISSANDYLFTLSGYVGFDFGEDKPWAIEPDVAVVWPTPFNPSIEPRIRGNYQFEEAGIDLNAATGIYRQTFEGISDERDAGAVFTIWRPTPDTTGRPGAYHAVAGATKTFARTGLSFTLETYYKRLWNLPVPRWSLLSRFTTTTALADGNVYGADARVTVDRGDFYGYVGYGYSVVEYYASNVDFGSYFGGGLQEYNPPHDQRHRVNVVAEYDFGFLKANLAWQFSTGLPFTQVRGFDSLIDYRNLDENPRDNYGTARVFYDRPYSNRLPTYHRLDVSVQREFDLGGSALKVKGGAINVYDRRNLFYLDIFRLRRIDQLPIVPYVGLELEVN